MAATNRSQRPELAAPPDPRAELSALLDQITDEHAVALDREAAGEDAVVRTACWGALTHRLHRAAEVAAALRAEARYQAHAELKERQAAAATARYARRADLPPDLDGDQLDHTGREERDLLATADRVLAEDSSGQAA